MYSLVFDSVAAIFSEASSFPFIFIRGSEAFLVRT